MAMVGLRCDPVCIVHAVRRGVLQSLPVTELR